MTFDLYVKSTKRQCKSKNEHEPRLFTQYIVLKSMSRFMSIDTAT